MAEREIEGFQVEVEHGRYARSPQNGVELELLEDSLIVEGEQGTGYLYQKITSYVPLTVLAELLRANGWTVEPP